ncbi:Aminomethyltransferase, mitochondrial, variant 2 [Orbilia ellipsospora]|uniref:Aminomethyltransferase n=1 Tax=Orbilia ellipsospora TaxID=2528407 RepID=A0AAV9XJH4_9PEZI
MASRAFNCGRRAVCISQQSYIQQRTLSTLPRLQQRAIASPQLQPWLHIPRPTQCLRSIPVGLARYSSGASEGLAKTPLHELHLRYGGKMVEFGGYDMPVQYSGQSIGESHKYVRSACGLFDVSHMVQHQFTGKTVIGFLESMTPSDLGGLQPFHSTLSVLLLPSGGIVDDTVITKHSDEAFYVVTNAGCRDKDLKYLHMKLQEWNAKHSEDEFVRHDVVNRGLVALQGPASQQVLQSLMTPEFKNLDGLYFGQAMFGALAVDGEEVSVHIARGGYTGEDGFEISIPKEQTEKVTEALLAAEDGITKLAGLGARDSLRLEAGMCLYGHDLNEDTTPVEGALTWVVAKNRRDRGDFPGAKQIVNEIKNKPSRRRVGLIVKGAPAREGAIIKNSEGKDIGVITSGCPSPTLGQNIAMGYVEENYKKAGTEIGVEIRGKVRQAVISKMPFVPAKYYKGEASGSEGTGSTFRDTAIGAALLALMPEF